jgi:hypothetical protein
MSLFFPFLICTDPFLTGFVGYNNVEKGLMAVMRQMQVLLEDYVW